MVRVRGSRVGKARVGRVAVVRKGLEGGREICDGFVLCGGGPRGAPRLGVGFVLVGGAVVAMVRTRQRWPPRCDAR